MRLYREEYRYSTDNEEADKALVDLCGSEEIIINRNIMKDKFIALGKNQIVKKDLNITTVNKVTDGTAVIFTGNELVYTIVLGEELNKNIPISVKQKQIMQQLRDLIHPDIKILTKGSKHVHRPFGCFNATVRNELVYDNRKLVGSAFTTINNKLIGHVMMYTDKSYKELNKYKPVEYPDEISPISLQEIGIDKDIVINNIKERLLNE